MKNKRNVDRLYVSLWKKACNNLEVNDVPVVRLRDLVHLTKPSRHADDDLELAHHMRFLENNICWFTFLATVFTRRLAPERIMVRSLISPILSISNLLMSFRLLTGPGLDFSMRVLARSIGEHCDVIRMLLYHPDLMVEYIVEDGNAANSFWHKHVSRGKARKKFFELLLKRDFLSRKDGSELEKLMKWEESQEKILSGFIHPTWVGGLANVLSPEEKDLQRDNIAHDFLGRSGRRSLDALYFVNLKTNHVQKELWSRLLENQLEDEEIVFDIADVGHRYLAVIAKSQDYAVKYIFNK